MEESISFGQQMPSMAIPEGDTVPETRDEILTLDEVATYLKAGKRTVYRLAQQGEIPAFKLGGTWRFRPLGAGSPIASTRRSRRPSERGPSQLPNHAPVRTRGRSPLTTQPLLTPYQSQYYAWLLTRRAAGDTVESLASTLVDAQVDLNPHQVEAQRNDLITQLEVQLQQRVEERTLFAVEWELL